MVRYDVNSFAKGSLICTTNVQVKWSSRFSAYNKSKRFWRASEI